VACSKARCRSPTGGASLPVCWSRCPCSCSSTCCHGLQQHLQKAQQADIRLVCPALGLCQARGASSSKPVPQPHGDKLSQPDKWHSLKIITQCAAVCEAQHKPDAICPLQTSVHPLRTSYLCTTCYWCAPAEVRHGWGPATRQACSTRDCGEQSLVQLQLIQFIEMSPTTLVELRTPGDVLETHAASL
jgi:hypothetical protein